MLRIPICPVCKEPVVEQPAENWTSPRRDSRTPWWHLADHTPICRGEDGSLSQATFVDESVPADEETRSWLNTMETLFQADAPSPGRLGSAIVAAEHLHRWLFLATGPFSALMTLRAPGDVALLVGHLYRTLRLLARMQEQTGEHFADVVRRQPPVGLGDEVRRLYWAVVRGEAHDTRNLLEYAASISADSARTSAVAWSCARRAALSWAAALPKELP